jgi:CheY-like chemotaxis protein
VLLLTGDLSEEVRSRALAAGADDVLTKPLGRAEVLREFYALVFAIAWLGWIPMAAGALAVVIAAGSGWLRGRKPVRLAVVEPLNR